MSGRGPDSTPHEALPPLERAGVINPADEGARGNLECSRSSPANGRGEIPKPGDGENLRALLSALGLNYGDVLCPRIPSFPLPTVGEGEEMSVTVFAARST